MIRPAAAADLTALHAIDSQNGWTIDAFARELSFDWSQTIVYGNGPLIAGFAVYWRVVDEFEILNIAVAPSHRRQGIARLLLQYVVDQARHHAAKRLKLEVRQSNEAALALYRSFGFRDVGHRPKYYPATETIPAEDALLLDLDLL